MHSMPICRFRVEKMLSAHAAPASALAIGRSLAGLTAGVVDVDPLGVSRRGDNDGCLNRRGTDLKIALRAQVAVAAASSLLPSSVSGLPRILTRERYDKMKAKSGLYQVSDRLTPAGIPKSAAL
jgi:hypothetical protein